LASRTTSEISHELRTPLAGVRAEAELALRHERSGAGYREALQRVLSGADQMERIIDTLLVVARQEAGSNYGTADAAETALRATESCAEIAASLGIEIAVSSAGPPVRVATDSDLAERILVPVIENACRYGRSRVTVTSARRKGTVVYTVGDDGPGVTQAESERIFEPGVRGAAGNGVGDGAGLGLALARRLARTVQGDVGVHPHEKGGCFSITLPSV
jgi:two-component system, OmpR family, sensor kinase